MTTPTAALKLCREQFEAWYAESVDDSPAILARLGSGYKYTDPQTSWNIWQASRQAATRATEPALDTERGLPQLPPCDASYSGGRFYSLETMQAYARAALDKAGDGRIALSPIPNDDDGKVENWRFVIDDAGVDFDIDVERDENGNYSIAVADNMTGTRLRHPAPQASADDARDAARYRFARPTFQQIGLTDKEIDAAIAIAALQRKEG